MSRKDNLPLLDRTWYILAPSTRTSVLGRGRFSWPLARYPLIACWAGCTPDSHLPQPFPPSTADLQLKVALKWSSAVLVTGGGGVSDGRDDDDDDDGNGGDHSHSRTPSSGSLSARDLSTSSPPPHGDTASRRRAAMGDVRAFSGERGGGRERGDIGAKRGCLPIHLGRLSLSAETELESGATAAEVGERLRFVG